ncbi:MAG TPA: hypothetical protein VGE66_11675 [Chitinophagaceae bacterium]
MARKENKGGILHNEDIERELQTRGGEGKTGRSYTGSQDTGDDTVRSLGTPVQQADGLTPDELQEGDVRTNRDSE